MGRLVVVDGLDGSGKTTQLTRLDAALTARGVPHRQISFPDYQSPSSALVKMYLGGELGESPQAVNAYAASSFYAVDRYAGFQTSWGADYRRGDLIVAARYVTSNAIHQMPKLPREEWDGYLRWLAEYEYERLELPRPDSVVFLDMPPAAAQELLRTRYGGDEGKKDLHERDSAYLAACRPAALYAAGRLGWHVIACAEGTTPRPPQEITAEILTCIEGDVSF